MGLRDCFGLVNVSICMQVIFSFLPCSGFVCMIQLVTLVLGSICVS